MSADHLADRIDTPGPSGLRGWLLVPTVMTALLPVANGVLAVEAFGMSAAANSATQAAWIHGSALAGLTVAWACAALLLFRRSPDYPRVYIGLTLAGFALSAATLMDQVWLKGIPPLQQDFRHLVLETVGATIWILSMRHSARVRNTFRGAAR